MNKLIKKKYYYPMGFEIKKQK